MPNTTTAPTRYAVATGVETFWTGPKGWTDALADKRVRTYATPQRAWAAVVKWAEHCPDLRNPALFLRYVYIVNATTGFRVSGDTGRRMY